jgi:23S rRNA (adenine2503-C2)-methyltransferase
VSIDAPLVADVRVGERRARTSGQKPGLIGLTRAELVEALIAAGERPDSTKLRARQLWHWLYHRGATSFAAMTTIAKDMRSSTARR